MLREGTELEIATQGSVNTWVGVERCVRFAFETARARQGRLTLAHKVRVLTFAGSLWQRTLSDVGSEYPDVHTSYENVDICCARMIEDPRRYDVVVADNMFGDILSDAACAVAVAGHHSASAELNVPQTGPSLFEADAQSHRLRHRHLPAARDDPLPAISAIAIMLDYLGDSDQCRHLPCGTHLLRAGRQDAAAAGDGGGSAASDRVIGSRRRAWLTPRSGHERGAGRAAGAGDWRRAGDWPGYRPCLPAARGAGCGHGPPRSACHGSAGR